MTNKQVVEKKAIVESTSQPEAGNVDTRKGDYTKFFYRNIERLWDAVESLQRENDRLEAQLKKARVVFAEGA
jgi:hypothetical protein